MSTINTWHPDDINLSDMEFWKRPWSEREEAFKVLRSQRPISKYDEPSVEGSVIEVPTGAGYYALTRYRDVAEASRHPEIFLSGPGAVSQMDLPTEMVEYFSGMISTDNPKHARLRRIVSNAFNPRNVRAVEDSIERVADETVSRAATSGTGDFVPDVAAPFPLEIICTMMGVPPSEFATVLHCSNVILAMGDPDIVPEGTDPILAVLEAGATLTGIMEELGKYRIDNPIDDITLHALSEHPDQKARLSADYEGLAKTATDEIVRWASPVIWMRRTLAVDHTLSGFDLKAGDKVLLFYNSANRDEEAFEDPFVFDVGRTPNDHYGFGAPGPHFCLGAHLARREITVIWRKLLQQYPDITSTGAPSQLASSFVNGIKKLPYSF